MNLSLLHSSKITNQPTFRFFKASIFLVLLVFANISDMKAQVYTYQVDQLPATPAFALLAGKATTFNTAATSYDNGVMAAIPIPFTFQFNGSTQPNINISVNGFATFGTAPALNEVSPISSAVGYTGVISPYGCDLDVITSSAVHTVGYLVTGTAPNRIFKIEWHVNRSSNPATTGGLDTAGTNLIFQAWLYETTNVVEFHYNSFTPTSTVQTNGQVGLRGTSNVDFRNLNWQTGANWPTTSMTLSSQPSVVGEVAYSARLKAGLPITNIATTSNRTFRFTPVSCFAPSGVTASSVTNSSANLSWTAPSTLPGSGYEYVVNTTATPTAPFIGPVAVPSGTSAAVTGLSSGTPYYVYVRSVCSAGVYSAWSPVITFTTGCAPSAVPYYLYVDPGSESFTVPNLPICTSRQQVGTGNLWVSETAGSGDGSFFDEHMVYNASGSQPANVWFYTSGVTLAAGQSYRIYYEYGGSTEFTFITNKMQVAYGNAPAASAMTTTLADHTNIKNSPIVNIVNFTAPSAGVFYFGFRAYSAANMGQLYLDNIFIEVSQCVRPLNIAVSNITGTTALLTWDAPTPVPANGYDYFLSTVGTQPDASTVISGHTTAGTTVVNLTGLSGSTNYYFWVRTNCGGGDVGEWTQLIVGANPYFTTLVNPVYTYCTPAPTSVDNVGIINVTMGTINNSTGDEPGHYGNYSSMVTNVSQGATIPVAITFNTYGFNYNTRIWVDWNNDSDFYDAGEEVYYGLSASSSPNTLNASFVVPAGATLGQHRIRIGGADIDTLAGTGAGQGPCYNGAWGTFEDYTLNVVVPPPALTIDLATSTQCGNINSPLVSITSPLSNYNTYTWSGSGVTGDTVSGFIFNNSTTTTYTLTAVQTAFPFSTNSVNFTYVANAVPTPITITPTTAATCQSGGTPATLTATGGVVSNIPVYLEDFNGTAPGWTYTNTSVGGAIAVPAWTLRPNGYNPGGSSGVGAMSSNDATQFVISNSDGQGSGTTTTVSMTSPVIDLTGYTNASLSFFHYYKVWVNGSATVQIYNPALATWNTIFTWGNTSNGGVTQGTATNFANVTYDLSAYVGQNNVQVRFLYTAQWGYVWAIDNFKVSGSATSAISWTPAAGLYTDAAATIPYVAGTGANVVYAMPAASQVYTATASTPGPTICSATNTASITVTPILGGNIGGNQNVCSGIITPITLTGSSGTITGWQTATNIGFTAGVTNVPSTNGVTVLTAALLGNVASTTYLRAVVTNGTCTAYSNIITLTVPSATWNGTAWSPAIGPNSTTKAIFAGNYSSTGNLNACSVTILSGNVVFNSGHSLIVQNGVTKTGGSLTFEDDASLVQVSDAAVNTGWVTYKRNTTAMIQYDYTYWSTPLSPQTLVGLSPLTASDKYFSFNTVGNSYTQVPSNTIMVPGKGYIIRAPNNYTSTPTIFPGIFNGGSSNGVPNNGVYTIPIVGPGPNNFNLIGNPYPSALDADLFLTYAANDAITDATLYFWTHNTAIDPLQYTGSDYAIYNLTGGVGTGVGTPGGGIGNPAAPNRYIAAGQGFFIKGTANGNATFNNSMRASGNNANFFRVSEENASVTSLEKNRVWLEMKNNEGAYKQTLVGYIETATNDRDGNFDGDTVEAGNVIGLYSVLGTDKLGIQGRALPFDVNDQVPLGYKSTIAGNFEIKLTDFDGLFSTQDIYLEDTVLDVIHDLKAGSYAFSTEVGTFDTRFILRYSNGASLGVNNPVFNENSVVVYKNVTGIHINTSNIEMEAVKIFDIRGRLILNKTKINSNETVIANLAAEEQVLLVQITAIDGRVITKKIVY